MNEVKSCVWLGSREIVKINAFALRLIAQNDPHPFGIRAIIRINLSAHALIFTISLEPSHTQYLTSNSYTVRTLNRVKNQ